MIITLESVEMMMVIIAAAFVASAVVMFVYDKPFIGKDGRRF